MSKRSRIAIVSFFRFAKTLTWYIGNPTKLPVDSLYISHLTWEWSARSAHLKPDGDSTHSAWARMANCAMPIKCVNAIVFINWYRLCHSRLLASRVFTEPSFVSAMVDGILCRTVVDSVPKPSAEKKTHGIILLFRGIFSIVLPPFPTE